MRNLNKEYISLIQKYLEQANQLDESEAEKYNVKIGDISEDDKGVLRVKSADYKTHLRRGRVTLRIVSYG